MQRLTYVKHCLTNYKGHEKLFEFYPQAKDITEIVDIIADYKK